MTINDQPWILHFGDPCPIADNVAAWEFITSDKTINAEQKEPPSFFQKSWTWKWEGQDAKRFNIVKYRFLPHVPDFSI